MSEIKISFEYIRENCKTIGDLRKLYSDTENLNRTEKEVLR